MTVERKPYDVTEIMKTPNPTKHDRARIKAAMDAMTAAEQAGDWREVKATFDALSPKTQMFVVWYRARDARRVAA
jgi:hypothetical protein